VTCPIHL